MKKLLLLLGLVALIASQAQAFDLRSGDFQIHLRDATSFYTQDRNNDGQVDAAEALLPAIPRRSPVYGKPGQPAINPADGYANEAPAVGDELRAVSNLDEVTYPTPPPINIGIGELVALTYDATLAAYNTDPITGIITAAFTGGKMQFWLDPTVEDLDGVSGTIDTGDVFNPKVGVNAAGGKAPQLWVENGRPEGDTYEGVNAPYPMVAGEEDAVLWLEVTFLPQTVTGLTIIETFNPATGFGASFDSFLLITGGIAAPLFEKGIFTTPLGASADLLLAFTSRTYPSAAYNVVDPYAWLGGWQAESSDPIQGRVNVPIPEPASLGLLGLGIAGLIYRRRQK